MGLNGGAKRDPVRPVIGLCALVLSCTGHLNPKLDLIQPYSYDLERKEPFAEPFLEHFDTGKKSLVYVAARHENNVNSPTFKLVDRAFDSYEVRIVILEGFPASYGQSPTSLIEDFAANVDGDFYRWGEPSYAALKAVERGIPFVGGEPDESDVLRAVQQAGFTAKDLARFYFARQIPQFLREESYHEKEPVELYGSFMPGVLRDLGLQPGELPFDEFLEWYEKLNGKRLDFRTFDPEESAPLDKGKYGTQRISHEVGMARERFIVTLIAELLDEYDHALVVYGKSHLAQQRPALQAMLGEPTRRETLRSHGAP
jgi:hypothetical protein